MNVIAVCGSPRKEWNTSALLGKALEGAASVGAQTKIIHLYDLDYKGCTSCFSCKLKDGRNYGHCAMNDGLSPVLSAIEESDALILGSPCYVGNVTGEMRSFMERLLFQNLPYELNKPSPLKKKLATGFIYTFGAPEERMNRTGMDRHVKPQEDILSRIFGYSESLLVNDTFQFDDYSRYDASMFDAEAKKKRRKEIFPIDCQKAFDMGVHLVEKARQLN